MRVWNEIDRNYIKTFMFRIKVLVEDYRQNSAVKELLSELEELSKQFHDQWYEMYVRLFELLNKYRRRFFSGDLQRRLEFFLEHELRLQSEAHWKQNEKVSKDVDVITLSIGHLKEAKRSQVQDFKSEVLPTKPPKQSNSNINIKDILITGATALGVGLIFGGLMTLAVVLWPVSVPLMIGGIVTAAVMGMASGFGLKKIFDSCFKSKKKEPVKPVATTRPRGLSEVYRMFLDLDGRPSTPVGYLNQVPKRENKKEVCDVRGKENTLDQSEEKSKRFGYR